MSIFNEEECPHCGEIIDVDAIWSSNDPTTEFSFECPHCGKAVAAELEMVPMFTLSKHRCEDCQEVLLEDELYCNDCRANREAARAAGRG